MKLMKYLGLILFIWTISLTSSFADKLVLNEIEVLKADKTLYFNEFLLELSEADVIIVGEYHNQLASHLLQQEILRLLANQKNLVVGVEWFSVVQQENINSYLNGEVTTFEFLQISEYINNWGFDFRLLAPTFALVKQHNIPLLGLNAPKEVTRKISTKGLQALDANVRSIFPDPLYAQSEKYDNFLRNFFESRKRFSKERINRMLIIQSVWDQTMAQTAKIFLQNNPNYQLLIFTGMVHAGKGQGIADVLQQMLPDKKIITIGNGQFTGFKEEDFDYYVLTPKISLPAQNLLGVKIDKNYGELMVSEVVKGSIADDIGLQEGDILYELGGYSLNKFSDLRAALWLVPSDKSIVLRWTSEIEILEITFNKKAELVFKSEIYYLNPANDRAYRALAGFRY